MSVGRAARATSEMGTMTVSNSGTQTDGDLLGYEQVDYSAGAAASRSVGSSTLLQSSSGSAFNAINTQTLPPSYGGYSASVQSSTQTQTFNNDLASDRSRYNTYQGHASSQGQSYPQVQGQNYGAAAYNTMQNTQSAFNYNSQVRILLLLLSYY